MHGYIVARYELPLTVNAHIDNPTPTGVEDGRGVCPSANVPGQIINPQAHRHATWKGDFGGRGRFLRAVQGAFRNKCCQRIPMHITVAAVCQVQPTAVYTHPVCTLRPAVFFCGQKLKAHPLCADSDRK